MSCMRLGHSKAFELKSDVRLRAAFTDLVLQFERVCTCMCTALYTQVRSLLADKRVTLETAPEAIEWLADVGFDPRLGARPLKRAIAVHLLNPLALLLLEGKAPEGSHVVVGVSHPSKVQQLEVVPPLQLAASELQQAHELGTKLVFTVLTADDLAKLSDTNSNSGTAVTGTAPGPWSE
eukprot:12880-Heterococcus_DN1.PRE.2